MYYANKSDFYIKQYGKNFLIGVLSVLLIGCGVYMYMDSKKPLSTDLVQQDTNQEQTESLKKDTPVVQEPVTPPVSTPIVEKSEEYFKTLENLIKSKEFIITAITDVNTICIEDDSSKMNISLIGIDYSLGNKDNALNKLKQDLLNQKVKIAFDKNRENGSVYLYVNNNLYNAEILKSGLVTLKSERVNIALNNDLAQAQKQARDSKLGVWKQ